MPKYFQILSARAGVIPMSLIALSGVIACSTNLPSETAGKTPCKADEVKILSSRHRGSTDFWTAECKGKSYTCNYSGTETFCTSEGEQKERNASTCKSKASDPDRILNKTFYLIPTNCAFHGNPTIRPISKVTVTRTESVPSGDGMNDEGDCSERITVSDGKHSDVIDSWYGERFDCLAEKDPRTIHPFNPSIWSNIRQQRLVRGMTEDAVYYILGHKIQRSENSDGIASASVVAYRAGWFLTFSNGHLISWTHTQ